MAVHTEDSLVSIHFSRRVSASFACNAAQLKALSAARSYVKTSPGLAGRVTSITVADCIVTGVHQDSSGYTYVLNVTIDIEFPD